MRKRCWLLLALLPFLVCWISAAPASAQKAKKGKAEGTTTSQKGSPNPTKPGDTPSQLVPAGESASIQALWEAAEAAKSQGQPRTAIEYLQRIEKKTEQDGPMGTWLRALGERIVMEATLEGNKPEEKVIRLQAVLGRAPQKARPLLEALLARWYWQYYQRNSWKFAKRTAQTSAKDEDFTTWDLPRLFAEIDRLFQLALKDPETLQKMEIEKIKMFAGGGDILGAKFRPTVFDFVAWEALSFYTDAVPAGAKAEDEYELEANSPLLQGREEFLKWNPGGMEPVPQAIRAIRIYQSLIAFHQKRGNRSAMVDVDLARLLWAERACVGEDKTQRCLKTLEAMAKEMGKSDEGAMVRWRWARMLMGQDDYLAARAEAAVAAGWDGQAPGVLGCRQVVAQVESPSFSLTGERALAPIPSTIRVSHVNVGKLTFQLFRDRWDRFLVNERGVPGQTQDADVREFLEKGSPVRKWDLELPPTKDYRRAETEIRLPALEPGFYTLVATSGGKGTSAPMIQCTSFFVSRMAGVLRSIPGAVEGLALDSTTGEPLRGVEVVTLSTDGRHYAYEPLKTPILTGDDGLFRLPGSRSGWNRLVLLRKDGEVLLLLDSLGPGWEQNTHPFQQTLLFTDRTIYRPGQSVHVKGVAISANHDTNEYQILAGTRINLVLLDSNHDEVSRQELQTNALGSFSATFVLPSGRLPGGWQLAVEHPGGSTEIRVEEYRRPRFSVTLEKPKAEMRLGENILVTGEAMGYTGASVPSATVRYRVERVARYPYWWGWFHPIPPSPAQVLAHGKTETDAGGHFQVSFPAKPDPLVSDPAARFEYRIVADVTDISGETRSGECTLTVGRVGLDLRVVAPDDAEDGKPLKLSLLAFTLDGQPLSAEGKLIVKRLRQPETPVGESLVREGTLPAVSIDLQSHTGSKPVSAGEGWPGFSPDWRTWTEEATVDTRSFHIEDGRACAFDFSLPAGLYRVEALSSDSRGNPVNVVLPLMVQSPWESASFSLKLPFSFVDRGHSLKVGEAYEGTWGTGYASGRALIEVFHRSKVVQRFWTEPGRTRRALRFEVKPEYRGGFTVHVAQFRNNRYYEKTVHVDVPWDNKMLDLSFETLRTPLEPGAKEVFRIRVKALTDSLGAAELAAALYDASLDQFVPHAWSTFSFFRQDYENIETHASPGAVQYQTLKWSVPDIPDAPRWNYPGLPQELLADWSGYAMSGRGWGMPKMASAPMAMAKRAAPAPAPMEAEKQELVDVKVDQLVSLTPGVASPDASDKKSAPSPADVKTRTNLSETAFFQPQLQVAEDGTVTAEFTMPEALTRWKFLALAHTADCRSGILTGEVVTKKDLMVLPNAPRFLREGDTLQFTSRVVNLSDGPLEGKARLDFTDLITGKPVHLCTSEEEVPFHVEAGLTGVVSWSVQVPRGCNPLTFSVRASAGRWADGEEGTLPVLSSRILVTEAVALSVRGPGSRTWHLPALKEPGVEPFRVTVRATANPAWEAIKALPYLMEFPHECAEQAFNRYYANALAAYVAKSQPRIRQVFEAWRGTQALTSPLEKNETLRLNLLADTPWVQEARSESEARRSVGLLFEEDTLKANLASALAKVRAAQHSDGSWSWFPGGPSSDYITLYIATGFGRLRQMGVPIEEEPARKAWEWLDEQLPRWWKRMGKNPHLTPFLAHYLYGRSFFLKEGAPRGAAGEVVGKIVALADKEWVTLPSRLAQAQLALALHRMGVAAPAAAIVRSARERSVKDENGSMHWKEEESRWCWWLAPVETQALMVELFDEVAKDPEAVEACKGWLLSMKRTRNWNTTKATADAVYALVNRGGDLLSDTGEVKIALGGQDVEPGPAEAGTGSWERTLGPAEVHPSTDEVRMAKEGKGLSWGGVHVQYFQELNRVKSFGGPLSVERTLLVKRDTSRGPVLEPVGQDLAVGESLVVRLVIRAQEDLEYVHLKDLRGSGLEPDETLSQWHWGDGLGWYQVTRDTATDFFFESLPRGTWVLELPLKVQHRGRYLSGMAEAVCMYAPEFAAHSSGSVLEVK